MSWPTPGRPGTREKQPSNWLLYDMLRGSFLHQARVSGRARLTLCARPTFASSPFAVLFIGVHVFAGLQGSMSTQVSVAIRSLLLRRCCAAMCLCPRSSWSAYANCITLTHLPHVMLLVATLVARRHVVMQLGHLLLKRGIDAALRHGASGPRGARGVTQPDDQTLRRSS
jgi:hypothetical protein